MTLVHPTDGPVREPIGALRTLVVYESVFGNTRDVALAVAEALRPLGRADAVEVSAAPARLDGVDLLIVGGPIHAFSMSRPTTRRDARQRAQDRGVAPVSQGRGLREWLDAVAPAAGVAAAAFDTAAPVPRLLPQGSAAAPAARRLEALGLRVVAAPEHFRVADVHGPLVPGEPERAAAWARGVAQAARGPVSERTPPAPGLRFRGAIVAVAALSALSAFGGAAELLYWPHGSPYVPITLLDHTPFRSFLVPGLLLGGVVGGTSAVAAVAAWRRSPWALDATLLAGGVLAGWIAAEMAQFREAHWLHAIYGGLGLVLLGLGLANGWWTRPRHRWVVGVTLAEAAGFLVPAGVGVAAVTAGLGPVPTAAAIVAAGAVEGLALGAGQGWAMPFPVDRARLAGLTALGAVAAWLLAGTAAMTGAPVALATGGAAAILALTGAQWLELRRRGVPAGRWFGWTAAAWALGLPWSVLPGLLVDDSTPVASLVALWACGGLLMAHVVALVSWQAVRPAAPAGRPG